jgi:hypothetical protein
MVAIRLRFPLRGFTSVEEDVAESIGFHTLQFEKLQAFSRLIVEGDVLLDSPTEDEVDQRRVHLVIAVELRPYFVTLRNLASPVLGSDHQGNFFPRNT